MARRTPEQLAETRQHLIDAATKLFSEKGVASTQIAEIAAAAGTGISAFYKQFKDKEELFLIIFERIFNAMHDNILQARRQMNMHSPLDMVMGVQRTYEIAFDTFYQHREISLSIFRSSFSASGMLDEHFWQLCNQVADEMSKDLERGNKAGLIAISNPRDFADASFGMIRQLAHRMLLEDSPSPHEAAKMCTKFTLGGLILSMPPAVLTRVLPMLAAPQTPTSTTL